MTRKFAMTRIEARDLARRFKARHVNIADVWDTDTLAAWLPADLMLRDGALFSGKGTIKDIATFLRGECITRRMALREAEATWRAA